MMAKNVGCDRIKADVGTRSGHNVTKRAISFRASMIIVWVGTSNLVFELIGQMMITVLM